MSQKKGGNNRERKHRRIDPSKLEGLRNRVQLINEMADQGWILQQVATPDDGVGTMVGVFYKERKL